jgi:hypothetical protein
MPWGDSWSTLRTLNWLGLSFHRAKRRRLSFQRFSAVRRSSMSAWYRGPGWGRAGMAYDYTSIVYMSTIDFAVPLWGVIRSG